MTERPSIYKNIHKAIRVTLARLSAEAARTDFRDPREAAMLRLMTAGTLELLADHAGHEDRHVAPLLRQCVPELAARLDAAHLDLEEGSAVLRRMIGVATQAG